MRGLLQRLGLTRSAADPKPQSARKNERQCIEPLETRRLFAGLDIFLTGGADTVYVYERSGNVYAGPNSGSTSLIAIGVTDIVVYAGAGNDNITMDTVVDTTIFGEDGDDTIYGGGASGGIVCGNGNDIVYGGGGTDTIWGNDGNDSLYGQDGDDYLIGGYGGDTFGGGNGYDVLDYSDRTDAGVTISIGGYSGNANDSYADLVTGDIERVQGTNFNDTIFGSANNDFIVGFGGNDTIYGFGGTDIIFAGDGDDTIYTAGDGSNVDQIYGENGYDSLQRDPSDGYNSIENFI